MFYHKDPRRIQPIVDFLMESFNSMDYNAEMSFDAVKIISLFRSFYEELGRKFSAWVDDAVRKSWGEIHSEHDDVGKFIASSPILIELDWYRSVPSSAKSWPFLRILWCVVGLVLFACAWYLDWMSVAPQTDASNRTNLRASVLALPQTTTLRGYDLTEKDNHQMTSWTRRSCWRGRSGWGGGSWRLLEG